jgi:glucosamine kinase
MSRIVVGVDGGGSHTRAMVADEHGTTIGTAEGGPSAVRPGEIERSAAVIAAVVADALAATGISQVPGVLCVGVAGVGRDAERDELQRALTARALADDVIVQPDAIVALDDAFGDGAGVLLVAGTGSIAYGRGPTGVLARVGGWGPVCGDEGGGAWIGRRALSVVTAAVDGREPATALVGVIVTAAEVRAPDDLIPWAARATPADLASLAPAVLRCADSGDRRAMAIVSFASEELVLHLLALARRLFVDERAAVPVAFAGGLLRRGSPLRARVEQRLKSAVPGAQVDPRDVDPVRGAVRAAQRLLASTQAS